jgi:hypothetical protein
MEWAGNSSDNSMQARLEKRFSTGLSFLAVYIWSKTIGDGSGSAGSGTVANAYPQNPLDLRAERSIANENRGQRSLRTTCMTCPLAEANGIFRGQQAN